MKKLFGFAAAAIFASTLSVSAATLVSQFTFDSGFSDSASGATASGDGTVSGGLYNFAANEGLDVTMGTGLATYSVLFSVALDNVTGYRKLMDVSGLSSDIGLYNLSGALRYYAQFSSGGLLTGGTAATIGLTFDGTTTRGYVNGVAAFAFAATGTGYLSTLTSFTLVEDDTVTSKGEASSGTLDFLEVYDGVLSANEIAAYAGPSVTPVPLPASGLLLFGALAGAAALRRKKALRSA